VVSGHLTGGVSCCRFPDTIGISVWAPDCFRFWTFAGKTTRLAKAAYGFTIDGFEYYIDIDTLQPIEWIFASQSYWIYTKPIRKRKSLPDALFALPGACQNFCKFRWD